MTASRRIDRDGELEAQDAARRAAADGGTALAEVRLGGGPLAGTVFLGPADALWRVFRAYVHEPKTYRERGS